MLFKFSLLILRPASVLGCQKVRFVFVRFDLYFYIFLVFFTFVSRINIVEGLTTNKKFSKWFENKLFIQVAFQILKYNDCVPRAFFPPCSVPFDLKNRSFLLAAAAPILELQISRPSVCHHARAMSDSHLSSGPLTPRGRRRRDALGYVLYRY